MAKDVDATVHQDHSVHRIPRHARKIPSGWHGLRGADLEPVASLRPVHPHKLSVAGNDQLLMDRVPDALQEPKGRTGPTRLQPRPCVSGRARTIRPWAITP